MVEISFDENTKQFVIEGAGELHIEILIKDLKEFSNCELNISEPVVPFRETVSDISPVCLAKSANKLNRIYCTAEPLSSELLKDIQEGKIDELMNDSKALSRYLVQKHGWDASSAKKIWCFGPDGKDKPSNILVDQTKSAEYLMEIKDHLISAFQTVCSNGVLAGEPLIGVRFNIIEIKVHTDNAHRGSGQIIPAATRLFRACQLLAKPRLVEPMFLASLTLPFDQIGSVYQYIGNKRTQYIDEKHEKNYVQLSVYLPVLESFGFDSGLNASTSGKCFPTLTFSHWQTHDSDPTIDKTISNTLVTATRLRKGLKTELPDVNTLMDKL
jgi:elongation factor 2